jgi:hypothetical protein
MVGELAQVPVPVRVGGAAVVDEAFHDSLRHVVRRSDTTAAGAGVPCRSHRHSPARRAGESGRDAGGFESFPDNERFIGGARGLDPDGRRVDVPLHIPGRVAALAAIPDHVAGVFGLSRTARRLPAIHARPGGVRRLGSAPVAGAGRG